MFETIYTSTDSDGVATVRLNRPEVHNAMSGQMIAELHRAADQLAEDVTVRAVVLTGTGKSFCAGGDLGWMKAQIDADRDQRRREARKLAMMLYAWNTLSKPVIARVQGNAFGGGIGLMSVCDVAIAVDGSKFGLTETRLGLIPATISPYVIARMGEAFARRVFMSSRLFDSQEAQTYGLIARTVAAEHLDATITQEVNPYLQTAPAAVAAAKKLARSLGPRIDESVIDLTIDRLVETWDGEEASHGVNAFLSKKKTAMATLRLVSYRHYPWYFGREKCSNWLT